MFKTLLVSFLAAAATAAMAAEPTIDSSRAVFHVGDTVMMCGVVSQVTKFTRGTYLNFGAKYPRQHIAVVVWGDDERKFNERFGGLRRFEGKRACARGTITEYRSALQLKVSNPQFLRLTQ